MFLLKRLRFNSTTFSKHKNIIKMVTTNGNGDVNKLDYRNKIILAPMVRMGTLPLRLLSLNYGADIVYTEELVDWKLLKTTRRINDVLGTVDFVDETDGTIVFRTCEQERNKVVLQIGTANAERALEVGKLVQADVAGIDINMGCPKEFSVKGGMGVALLANPENAKKILKTLVEGLNIPITCKIRIFPDVDRTINLVKEFQEIGISAITVHGRTRQERPQHPVHCDAIKQVTENLTIPVIANGGSKEIKKHSDLYKFRNSCGASSVMIARAAQWNASIFNRDDDLLPLDDVIKEYLKLCVDYDNSPSNSKYCVQMMLRDLQESPRGRTFLESQTLEELCDIWDLGSYCRKKQLEYQERGMQGRRDIVPSNLVKSAEDEPETKKAKIDDNVIENNVAFFRAHYDDVRELPKSILHLFAVKNGKAIPTYETQQVDRLFRTIVKFDKKKYASSYWEKNKRFAEQGAALVCILRLGLIDEAVLIANGSILK